MENYHTGVAITISKKDSAYKPDIHLINATLFISKESAFDAYLSCLWIVNHLIYHIVYKFM